MRNASLILFCLFSSPATGQISGIVDTFDLASSVTVKDATVGIGFHAGDPLSDPSITAYYMRAAFAVPPAGATQAQVDEIKQNGIYFVIQYLEARRVDALTGLCEATYDGVLARVRLPSEGTQPYAALLAAHKPRYYRVDVSFGLRALQSQSKKKRFAQIKPISQVFRVDRGKCTPVTIAPSAKK